MASRWRDPIETAQVASVSRMWVQEPDGNGNVLTGDDSQGIATLPLRRGYAATIRMKPVGSADMSTENVGSQPRFLRRWRLSPQKG